MIEDKIKNIKELRDMMNDDTKNKADEAAIEEFGLKNVSSFRQNYLYYNKIPSNRIDRLIEIFQNALKVQIEVDRKRVEELGI